MICCNIPENKFLKSRCELKTISLARKNHTENDYGYFIVPKITGQKFFLLQEV